jgi:hypothetical protein
MLQYQVEILAHMHGKINIFDFTMQNYRFRKNKSYFVREIDDIIFLVRVTSKKNQPNIVVLDEKSHVMMWQLLSKYQCLKELSEAAMNKFDFKDLNEAKKCTYQFIEDLINKGVLIKG